MSFMKKAKAICFISLGLFVLCSSVHAYETITTIMVEQHSPRFVKYIENQRSLVSWFRCLWPRTAQKVALLARSYRDSFSLKCIESSYPFFDRAKNSFYVRTIVALLAGYADHVNTIVQRYRTERPKSPDSLCRITYEETVKHAPYDQKTQDTLIAAGLLAKYFIEEVKN